jgi:hypothetical protein
MGWIIANTKDPELCWSNEDGWTTEGYDTFTDGEKAWLTLPLDGMWERVPWEVQG